MNANPKINALRDRSHLDSFRDMDCLARGSGIPCEGDVVGHHLTLGWHARGMKAPDNWALPLCHGHHRLLHATGEQRFWLTVFQKEPVALAEILKLAAERLYEERGRE